MYLLSRAFAVAAIFPWMWLYTKVQGQFIDCMMESGDHQCSVVFQAGMGNVAMIACILSAIALVLSLYAFFSLPRPRPWHRIAETVVYAFVFRCSLAALFIVT